MNAETKHTPGPWRVKHNPGHDAATCDITIAGDIFLLADIKGPNYPHCEANARLIAAAPEMAAALRSVEQWWLSEGMHEPGRENSIIGAPYAIFHVRAALLKAGG